MKSVGMLIILIAMSVGYAQIPDTLWTKTYGGAGDDWAAAVRQASDGGYIIVATTNSFGTGSPRIWLLKTDAHGDTLWTRTYSNSDYFDAAGDVQQTSDGGYIIAGTTDQGLFPSFCGWLIKTDSIGEIEWEAMHGCGYGSGYHSVMQTSDEGFIATGSVGDYRYNWAWSTRTDSLGNVLWSSGYSHSWYPHASIARSVIQTSDGCYVTAGECNQCFYYFKTDSLGNTLWYNVHGSGNAYSIQQTPDQGFIVAGHTGDYWSGEADILLVKSNSGGGALWMCVYGGPFNDVGHSVEQTADDGYIIAGYTESSGLGSADIWLLKTNASGDTLWTTTYGGAAEDIGNSVKQTADGGYIIAGHTESFGAGGRDVYLIKTAPDIGIEEGEMSVVRQNNLTATIIRGPLHLPEGKKCRVFDISGRLIDPTNIQPGIYFVEVEGVVTQKVVKVR